MTIIGERLNSSIPDILEALNNHDEQFMIRTIKKQSAGGADFLDINTALTGEKEVENMLWLISLALTHSTTGIMLDSPQPDSLIECIKHLNGRNALINSIMLDKKFDGLINAAKEYNAGIVCLPMVSGHVPQSAAERLENAKAIVEKLTGMGISKDKIYIDVLIEAISTNQTAALVSFETLELIKKNLPGVKTICGLSNVSFGLPKRSDINATFLAMALAKGLDSAILNVTNQSIRQVLATSNAILGNDEFCLDYIKFCR